MKKNLKLVSVTGLLILIIYQLLLSNGPAFLYAQKPIDYTHWLMLIAAVLLIPSPLVFPKNIFNYIAAPLTLLGIVAHIGMCAIDFTLWSYGTDYESRDTLIRHLMDTPSIWLPFFVIGPSFLYAGLATQAWHFIRSHTFAAIASLLGSALVGFGQFMGQNRWVVVGGTILFAIGLSLLIYRKEKRINQ